MCVRGIHCHHRGAFADNKTHAAVIAKVGLKGALKVAMATHKLRRRHAAAIFIQAHARRMLVQLAMPRAVSLPAAAATLSVSQPRDCPESTHGPIFRFIAAPPAGGLSVESASVPSLAKPPGGVARPAALGGAPAQAVQEGRERQGEGRACGRRLAPLPPRPILTLPLSPWAALALPLSGLRPARFDDFQAGARTSVPRCVYPLLPAALSHQDFELQPAASAAGLSDDGQNHKDWGQGALPSPRLLDYLARKTGLVLQPEPEPQPIPAPPLTLGSIDHSQRLEDAFMAGARTPAIDEDKLHRFLRRKGLMVKPTAAEGDTGHLAGEAAGRSESSPEQTDEMVVSDL